MIKSLLTVCAAVALFLSTAQAQLPITLRGTVDALPAVGCDPNATHKLRCTDVQLKSATIDLTTLEGRTVDITGDLDPLLGCVSVEVTAAENAAARTTQFALFGTRLGRPVIFTSQTPPGSLVFYFWSCGPGFLPLGPLGTVLIDIPDAIMVGSNLSIGIDIRTETIPNNPNLVGQTFHYQFGYVSVLTGIEVGFLNPGCLTVQQ